MVLPLGDENPRFLHTRGVTQLLIAVNIAMFIIELLQGSNLDHFLTQFAVVPIEYTQHRDVPPGIPFPYWFTLLSAMFLHGGWLHIIANMVYLRIFGDNVEEAMGPIRFLLFYLLCGVAGALAHIWTNPTSTVPSLGASGAIAGVLGAYLLMYPRNRVQVLVMFGVAEFPALLVLGFWGVIQVVNGLVGWMMSSGPGAVVAQVAYGAHVGGFLAGMLLVPFFRQYRPKSTGWF